MSSLNKCQLIGNVGKEVEIRHLQSGDRIASFSVATSETWKDKSGQKQERTQWHNIVVFNQNIVNVVEKYVHKGSKVYIEGQIETRKWQDKTGQDKYTTEIVLKPFRSELVLLDTKGEKQMETRTSDDLHNAAGAVDDFEDSIPF